MKRLVWLMLLAFGALLVQVPAVEPLTPKAPDCGCCQHACKGSMDCSNCLACAPGGLLAIATETGLPSFMPAAVGRVEVESRHGRRLCYRPLLPPPRPA